ncbi:MAG: hypothetical protein WBB22_11375 [Anaerolineae bacterium]
MALPAIVELRGEAQVPKRAVPDMGEGAILDGLDEIETSTLAQVLVEKAVNLFRSPDGATSGSPGSRFAFGFLQTPPHDDVLAFS